MRHNEIAAITDYMNYNLGTVAGIVLTVGDFRTDGNPFHTTAHELTELRRARDLLDREISRREADLRPTEESRPSPTLRRPRMGGLVDLSAVADAIGRGGRIVFDTNPNQGLPVGHNHSATVDVQAMAHQALSGEALPKREPQAVPAAPIGPVLDEYEAGQVADSFGVPQELVGDQVPEDVTDYNPERTQFVIPPVEDQVAAVRRAKENPGEWQYVPGDPHGLVRNQDGHLTESYVPGDPLSAPLQPAPYEPEPPHVVQLSCGHKVRITYPHGDWNGNAIRCAGHPEDTWNNGKPDLRTVVGFLPVQTVTDAVQWEPQGEVDTGAHHLDDSQQ